MIWLGLISFIGCNPGESKYPILEFPGTDHIMQSRQVKMNLSTNEVLYTEPVRIFIRFNCSSLLLHLYMIKPCGRHKFLGWRIIKILLQCILNQFPNCRIFKTPQLQFLLIKVLLISTKDQEMEMQLQAANLLVPLLVISWPNQHRQLGQLGLLLLALAIQLFKENYLQNLKQEDPASKNSQSQACLNVLELLLTEQSLGKLNKRYLAFLFSFFFFDHSQRS